MSYLLVVVIGAVVGWVAGQYMKGSEYPVGVDFAAGALGACVLVLLSRLVGPPAAAGYLVGVVVSIIGAVGALFGTRAYMKAKMAPVARVRRR